MGLLLHRTSTSSISELYLLCFALLVCWPFKVEFSQYGLQHIKITIYYFKTQKTIQGKNNGRLFIYKHLIQKGRKWQACWGRAFQRQMSTTEKICSQVAIAHRKAGKVPCLMPLKISSFQGFSKRDTLCGI